MLQRKRASSTVIKFKYWALLPIAVWTTIATTEARAKDLFEAIAWCESRNMQFNADGTVHKSPNGEWIGKFQINKATNGADARQHGFNIYTKEGNEGYARNLYARRGWRPWIGSRHCWGPLVGKMLADK